MMQNDSLRGTQNKKGQSTVTDFQTLVVICGEMKASLGCNTDLLVQKYVDHWVE